MSIVEKALKAKIIELMDTSSNQRFFLSNERAWRKVQRGLKRMNLQPSSLLPSLLPKSRRQLIPMSMASSRMVSQLVARNASFLPQSSQKVRTSAFQHGPHQVWEFRRFCLLLRTLAGVRPSMFRAAHVRSISFAHVS